MGRKGLSTPMQLVAGFLLLALVGGGIYGAYSYVNQGSGVDDGETDGPETPDQEELPWDGIDIKVNLEAEDLAGEDVTDGEYHVFDSEPENWGDDKAMKGDLDDADMSMDVDSDGVTTLQDNPGEYFVVLERDGAYLEQFKVDIPGGDGRFGETYDNPGEYNENPTSVDVVSHDRYSLGSEDWDLGIDENTSEETEYSEYVTYDVEDDTEYRMDYIVVQTGDVDATKDEDVDGTYDEGISQSYVEVEGAKNSDAVEQTFFEPDLGVDELGSDNQAKVEVEGDGESYLEFDGDNKPTVEVGITAQESSTEAESQDEVASDGENFWDINYFDSAGNSNSVGSVTG